MKPLRIGKIEYRESKTPNGNAVEEIVLWQPNAYYGKEDSLKADGWTFDSEGNATDMERSHCLHSSVFKNRETCYVVAFIEWNGAHDEFDTRVVGTRAFELNDEDFGDFKTILSLIEKNSGNY